MHEHTRTYPHTPAGKKIHLMILLIEVFTLKNNGNENFLMREMQKNVSNIKVSLVISCFMEIIADYCKKSPITKGTFIFETFFHISSFSLFLNKST